MAWCQEGLITENEINKFQFRPQGLDASGHDFESENSQVVYQLHKVRCGLEPLSYKKKKGVSVGQLPG